MCPLLPPSSDEIGITVAEEREFILSKIYELKNPVLAAADDELAGASGRVGHTCGLVR